MNEIQKKRIEEAAWKYSESCRPDESLYGIGVQIGYLQGFLKGSEYALSHQWISVEEALPEIEGDGCSNFVLAKFNDCIPEIAKYTDNTYTTLYSYKGADGKKHENHWFDTYANPLRHDITHWMPVPEFETTEEKENQTEEKCCGNCVHFTNEDINGNGWCSENDDETTCGQTCTGWRRAKGTGSFRNASRRRNRNGV